MNFDWTISCSRSEVLCKKVVRKIFAKLTGEHLCQSLERLLLLTAASEVSFVSAASEDYMNMIHTSSGINLFEEA